MPLRTTVSPSSAETVQRVDGDELEITLQNEVDDEASANMASARSALSRAEPGSGSCGSPYAADAAERQSRASLSIGDDSTRKEGLTQVGVGPEEKGMQEATAPLQPWGRGLSESRPPMNRDGIATISATVASLSVSPEDGTFSTGPRNVAGERANTSSYLTASDVGGCLLSQGLKDKHEGTSSVAALTLVDGGAASLRSVRAAAKSLVRCSGRQLASSSRTPAGTKAEGVSWPSAPPGHAGELAENAGPTQDVPGPLDYAAGVGEPCELSTRGDESSEASAPSCFGVLCAEGASETGALREKNAKMKDRRVNVPPTDKASPQSSLVKKRTKASGAVSVCSGRSPCLASLSRGNDATKKRQGTTSPLPVRRVACKRPSVPKCRKGASAAGRRGREEDDCDRQFLRGQVKRARRNMGDGQASAALSSHHPTLSPFQRSRAHNSPYHWLPLPHSSGSAVAGRGSLGGHCGCGGVSGGATGGRSGGLSERVRRLVEQTMSEKHRVVWIDRGEAKGFLPLPGMQEERVYLVWTEKGIDILVDVQAYIPWTHCPVLMQTKYRRNQIPFLILSSTSLALLFSHVCRRNATAVFRLPLARTPQAYRKHVLNLLRTGEAEKRSVQCSKSQRRRSPCSSPSPNARTKTAFPQGDKSPQLADAASASVGDSSDAPGNSPSASRSASSPPPHSSTASEEQATHSTSSSVSAACVSLPDEGRDAKVTGDQNRPVSLPSSLTAASSLASSVGSSSPSQAESPPLENALCTSVNENNEKSASVEVVAEGSADQKGQDQQTKGEKDAERRDSNAVCVGGICAAPRERAAAGTVESSVTQTLRDETISPVMRETEQAHGLAATEAETKQEAGTGNGEHATSANIRSNDHEQGTTESPAIPHSSPCGGDQPASHSATAWSSGSPSPGDRGYLHGSPGASKDGSMSSIDADAASPSLQDRGEEEAEDALDEDLFWANGGKKGCPLTAVDMRDFYCCSQGKVIGEDYIYFRQYLPDDEGADIYDLNVSVRKRPKKLLLKKSRAFANGGYSAGASALRREDRDSSPPSFLTKRSSFAASSSLASDNFAGTGSGSGDVSVHDSVHGENGPFGVGKAHAAGDGEGGEIELEAPGVVEDVNKDQGACGGAGGRGQANKHHPAHLLRLLMAPNKGRSEADEAGTKEAQKADGNGRGGASGCKNWTYVDDYEDDGMDPALDLPYSFTSEVRVLLGLAPSPTPHRCNMSLASHRVSGAVQRRFRIYQCSPDGERREEEVDPFESALPSLQGAASDDEDEEKEETSEERADDEKENEKTENKHWKDRGTCSVKGGEQGEKARDETPVKSERGSRSPTLPEDRKETGDGSLKREKGDASGNVASLTENALDEKPPPASVSLPAGRAEERIPSLEDGGKKGTEERGKKESCVGETDDATEKTRHSKDHDGGEATAVAEKKEQGLEEQDGNEEESGGQSRSKASSEHDDSEVNSDDDGPKGKARNKSPSFALSSHDLPNGSLAEVDYPTEFSQFRESDRIRIYDKTFLSRALQLIVDVAIVSRGADLSAVNVAQYAPNLFWNIIRFSRGNKDIDEVVRTIAPSVTSLRSARGRRKRGEMENSSFLSLAAGRFSASRRTGEFLRDAQAPSRWLKRSKTGQDDGAFCLETWLAGAGDDAAGGERGRDREGAADKAKQREERRQKELEERFEEMKVEFEEKAQRMIARRAALTGEIYSDGKGSKKPRVPSLPENDDDALIEIIIDPEQGILKWPLSVMSIRQRTVIYQECLRRDLTACIHLTKVPGKGRAVFAADTILKDDFVVEYKGELCSEREAREREQRYNRSKVPMGSFMFYFKNGSRMMAIDATDEKQDFGPARLINHSRRNPNMTPRAITLGDFNSEPRLIFVARRNIEKGEELLVDYGERDPDVIKEHPWLNS
ncbi:histone lysine methyltransferase SET8 [Toxoplasma gondii TgCatPRC2]|uniref:Histone lysine methyltransferase SET8 n=4 Tax=Toxoplasma gondii TaxID=5811 RepID=S7UKM8_TOXGG|nr:histone lysine methyltransferase SET8 [Toxoplasma gondii ME49]EPR58290.1 histone lysine methyltransferase SET8 [Toxoplasma gondii GT1]EPT31425.1 histone lysine methyltransferase SET8 [Toxoplasma gondii ME49]KAF4645025.1 histone lysine methyltransferase SET8 [Toxoplasma gondii]KYK63914.1 histone lysine methyltransferase SET8 [Toxoplasma gondii TgCatPRC2]|eukprot:XP_002371298.1 histone lysine methyltransferase SET8 [Toxoplasma gondii ME49]